MMETGLGEVVVRRTPEELLRLTRDGFALLGHAEVSATAAIIVDLDGFDWGGQSDALVSALAVPGPVLIGFSSEPLPAAAEPLLEQFTVTLAPDGPGRAWVPGGEDDLTALCEAVAQAPGAAVALHGLLRGTDALPVPEAVVAEAATYSMLLGGDEFARWRAATPQRPVPPVVEPLLLERDVDTLRITLDNPARRNAFSAPMRDALVEALRLPAVDPSIARVELRGNGPVFCSGGDL